MITFEKILFLKTIPLFENVPEYILCDMIEQSNEITAPANSDIVKEGDILNSMYIIMQGTVSVYKKGKLLHEMKKGEVFGEVYAFSPYQSEVTISANEDASLLQIDNNTIYSLVDDHPDLAKTLISELCRRLRKAEIDCL